ncbi:MAG: sodium:proton antiporter [Anaerolineae bacterium]|jgi:multicomponent Na+:H+ antiporter subunit C|nr:sodium:proton antiporter [Anaerolineae bacterium]
MNVLFAIATGIMFGMGVFQLLRRDLIKAAMGFYILFTAINLLFLAVGAYDGVIPAYAGLPAQGRQTSDPLVQALILTAIVISFGSYALLLGLIAVSSRRFKTVDSDEVDHLKG